jgi:D-alanyl-D-alanine carboxypeptidase
MPPDAEYVLLIITPKPRYLLFFALIGYDVPMRGYDWLVCAFLAGALFLGACRKTEAQSHSDAASPDVNKVNDVDMNKGGAGNEANAQAAPRALIARALKEAGTPAHLGANILEAAENGPFMRDLAAATAGDPFLYLLVDKTHPLPPGYEPDDLVPLRTGAYRVNRGDLSLRREAEASLTEMAEAARAEGVTLVASSSYRSEAYQKEVYERNVRQSGQETADRESARPGRSQHQTGLVIDFGSITDEFAATPAGKWLLQNASRFGWSLSFPDGYEQVTGYRWESWHYRYVGKPLSAFIDIYFGGIQQYALEFLHAYTGDS